MEKLPVKLSYADVVLLAHEILLRDSEGLLARFALGAALRELGETAVAAAILQGGAADAEAILKIVARIADDRGNFPTAVAVISPAAAAQNPEGLGLVEVTAAAPPFPFALPPDGTAEAAGEGIPPEFYTTTTARLFLNQGHVEAGVEILRHILARDAGNLEAREMLDALPLPDASPSSSMQERLSRFLSQIERVRALP